PWFVVASPDSRFLDCERTSAVADDLSSLGMTGFLGLKPVPLWIAGRGAEAPLFHGAARV
ncbi:MAG: hypothetical protein WAM47_19845, partial [Candidatus Sulfotelmatobacter sp.]